ncbi:hypothetical protein HZS_1608, partial [Henneguya salminicola]
MSSDLNIIPNVSGISPSEGPPGTKITIRGHNLGKDAIDLISVHVCDCDCTKSAKWISPGKIICVVDSIKFINGVSGPVSVTTKSGGQGISPINFNVSFNRLKPLTVSSIWIEEDYGGIVPGHVDLAEMDMKEMVYEPDPLGILPKNVFSSGTPITSEPFVQYTSNLVDTTFHPMRFLLDRHPNTKWENFKKGYGELKRNLNLSSSIDSQTSGSYLTKNISVVINVMSDMYKLSKLINDQPISGSPDLMEKLQHLCTDISLNFNQLAHVYSNMISCMSFLNLYYTYYENFKIAIRIKKCLTTRSNYMKVIDLCSRTSSVEPEIKMSSFLISIDTRVAQFAQHVIKNLSMVYPIQFPSLLEFSKKIDKLRGGVDHSIFILKNHQEWVHDRLNSAIDSFTTVLNQSPFDKFIFLSRKKQFTNFCEKITLHITDFCHFFARELTLAENIVEFKNAEQRKLSSTHDKKDQSLLFLTSVDSIFNNYVNSFILTLRKFLLNPWNVQCVSRIDNKDIYCTMTIVDILQIVRIFNSIIEIILHVKNSSISGLRPKREFSETTENFSFTFHTIFLKKFNEVLFESLSILKIYYCARISELLIFTYKSEPLPYYKNMSWSLPIFIYSIIYEWLMIFREIFAQLDYLHIFGAKLPQKFEQIYPRKFLIGIVMERIDSFLLSKKSRNIDSLLTYYDFINNIQKILLEKLESSSLFSSPWEKTPISSKTLLDSFKQEFIEIAQNTKNSLLVRTCELSLSQFHDVLNRHTLTLYGRFQPMILSSKNDAALNLKIFRKAVEIHDPIESGVEENMKFF